MSQLAIVPVENSILHEYHDVQRTPHLIKKLFASGVLRNPPIVIPMRQIEDSFMVLDGANRVSAFRRTGIPHILVQIVQADDPNLDLNAWNHVLWGIPPDDLFNSLRKVPGIMLQPGTQSLSFRDLMDIHALASIHLPNGSAFTAFTPSVDPYPDGGRVRVFLELTPFQQKPHGDILIMDKAGNVLAGTSFIEAVTPKFEMTLYLRSFDPDGDYQASATLYYVIEVEDEVEGDRKLVRPEKKVVDHKTVRFTVSG